MLRLSYFSCTCLSWLALLALVYHFAMPRALFISVPCIQPSSSILLTFFCNWETSQFLSRPFSFSGIPCSLIISNHVSPCTAWPQAKCENHWKILRKLPWVLLSSSLFNRFSLAQCPQSHRCLSFILKSCKAFWLALNYRSGQKEEYTLHREFCHVPQCLHQSSPFWWTLSCLHLLPKLWSTHGEVNPLWSSTLRLWIQALWTKFRCVNRLASGCPFSGETLFHVKYNKYFRPINKN